MDDSREITPSHRQRLATKGVFAIFIVTVFNYMDRSIISILLDDIAKEFSMSDFEIGVLSGLPFALFYAIVGLAFARVADYSNRRYLIAIAVAVWSLATAACGLATGFGMLLALRVCVGIGEGAGTPASHSILAETVPADRRAAAASILTLAGALGGLLGYSGAGAIADQLGWRAAFVVVGLPGLLVAFMAYLMIPEPRVAPRIPSLSELLGDDAIDVAKKLLSLPSFRNIIVGFTIVYFVQMGISQWTPIFLIRSFGVTLTQVGLYVGFISAGAMAVGTIIGGVIGDRLAKIDVSWYLRIAALCGLAMAPCYLAFIFSDSFQVALFFLLLSSFLSGIYFGPLFASLYAIAGADRRATAVALSLLTTNIIGLGIGPLFIGSLSEIFSPIEGKDALSFAMAISSIALPIGSWFLFRGSRSLRHDITTT